MGVIDRSGVGRDCMWGGGGGGVGGGVFFFFQAEDGIRDDLVTGVQTCALPIFWSDWVKIGENFYGVRKFPQSCRSHCSEHFCASFSFI